MKRLRKSGSTSNVERITLKRSDTAQGLTGLTTSSSGLVISTIADVEASATSYTAAGATLDSIATLGTYAAPTSGHCRFKEIDSTNHPGDYEFQFADARYAVSGAKELKITISGAANLLQRDVSIQLTSLDVDNATNGGLGAIPAGATAGASGGLPVIGTGTNQFKSDGSARMDVGSWLGNAVTVDGNNYPNVDMKDVSGTAQTAGDEVGDLVTLLGRLLGTLTTTRASNLDNLDAAVSSRLAASAYTAPDNGDAAAAAAAAIAASNNTTTLLTRLLGTLTLARATYLDNLANLDAAISSVKAQTDKIGTNADDSPNEQTAQATVSTNNVLINASEALLLDMGAVVSGKFVFNSSAFNNQPAVNVAGDFTSQMKADLDAATPAAIQGTANTANTVTLAASQPNFEPASSDQANTIISQTAGGSGGGGSLGSGADQCTMTINRTDGSPIPDADVWITSDSAGDHIVAGTLQTNSQGNVTFLLDNGVGYYLWMEKDGEQPILGQAFTAQKD